MTVHSALYDYRFDAKDRAWKAEVWKMVCEHTFQAWVAGTDTVLDLGAGHCELINSIKAQRRIALDLSPELAQLAGPGVEARVGSATDLSFLGQGEVDVAFTSNFLEHLPDKNAVLRLLGELRRVLKPGGRLIVIGPNVRLLAGRYWDYFDHHVPLSEKSLAEALNTSGFSIDRMEARFLPYTVKSHLPRARWLVKAYLALRPLSSAIFGKQFLVVARSS